MELILVGLGKLLGSAGFGTVFGGVMGLLNRREDLRQKRMEMDHEIKMREADAKIMEQEWAGRTRVADIEATAAVDVAGFGAMAKSYEFAKPADGSKMAAFSSFVRPFISLCYFVVSSAGAYYVLKIGLVDGGAYITLGMVEFVIEWMAFMSSATIGWWFAMRPGKMPSR